MCALKAFATALALVLAAPSSAAPDRWQDLPASLRLEPVGDSLRMNGTPISIRAFRTSQAPDALLREVEANWTLKPDHQPVYRSRIPNWSVLNQTIGERHRSFQVREEDGVTHGFIAVTSPKEMRDPLLVVRLPAQVQAVQVIDSIDAGKSSQQVVAVSQRSVEATAIALSEALATQHWDKPILKKQGASVHLSANRGGEQFDAVLTGQKNSALLMINTIR